MNYTDQQLQIALAKITRTVGNIQTIVWDEKFKICRWVLTEVGVKETEWLHVCWLIEQALDEEDHHVFTMNLLDYIDVEDARTSPEISASWQQHAVALAKLHNIEIV